MTHPTVNSEAVTDITDTSCSTGGTVTSIGSAAITGRGLVYNLHGVANDLNHSPPDQIITLGGGLGHFGPIAVSGLNPTASPDTLDYNIRAWARNGPTDADVGYGVNVAFTLDAPGGGGGGGGGGPPPLFIYPHVGPDSLAVDTEPRMRLDDGNLPSRATLLGFNNFETSDQAQAMENAYRAAMLAEARVGWGWVPQPSDINFSVGTPTAGIDALTEQNISTGGVDVSHFLAQGTKIRVVDGGDEKFFIVNTVSGSTFTMIGARGSSIPSWLGGGWPGQTPLASIDAGSLYYSRGRAPGFPASPMVWSCRYTSPVDSNGQANGDNLDVTPADTNWHSPNSNVSIFVPAGPWALSFQTYIEVSSATPNDVLAFRVGLHSETGTAPGGDMQYTFYDAHSGAAPACRVFCELGPIYRTCLVPTHWYIGYRQGQVSPLHARNDDRLTIISAVSMLL